MTLLTSPRLQPVDRTALASASTPPGFGGAVPWTVAQLRDYADLVATQHRPLRVRVWRITRGGLQRPIHECAACVHAWPCQDERWRRDAATVLPWLADNDPVIGPPAPPPSAADPPHQSHSGDMATVARSRGRHAAPPPRRRARQDWAALAAGPGLAAALAAALWLGFTG